MSAAQRFLVYLFRFCVGLLFILSGLIKVNDPKGFLYKIQEYIEVFHAAAPGVGLRDALLPLTPAAAIGISVVEVAVGLFLLIGLWRAFTTFLLLAMIVFFTLLTGYSAITNAVTDCGCFGEVLKLTPWQSFSKDVVLLAMILVLLVWSGSLRPLIANRRVRTSVALALVALTAITAFVTYRTLPLIDFTAFALGKNIPLGIETRKPDGERVIKDYLPLKSACGADTFGGRFTSEFDGPLLWVVATDLATLDSAHLSRVQAFAKAGVRVAVLTASGAAERQAVAAALPGVCLMAQDLTLLKTIVRSSPGYLWLQSGTVAGKWPAGSPPELDALTPR